MPLNNPAGNNQHGEKLYPPDDILKDALLQYTREGISREKRLIRLRERFGLEIKLSTLKRLYARFEIPIKRDSLPLEQQDAVILNEIANDAAARRGVDAVLTNLRNNPDGPILVSREAVRTVRRMHTLEAVIDRFPGSKKGRPARKTLLSVGPNEMHHADGWEKLGAQALQMGGVGIPAYGFTDQCSSKRLYLVAVPNDRLADVIVHVQLDFIDHIGGIAVTHVVDKGSELGKAMDVQRQIRAICAPDLDENRHPPVVHLSSFKNTPQEGAWHWLRNFDGYNLHAAITAERDRFNGTDALQSCLFYWIWVPVVQQALDQFVQYWNTHRIRFQREKANPSGETPNHVYEAPQSLGLTDCLIRVEKDIVQHFRAQQAFTREQALAFCSESFSAAATTVHRNLGSPQITQSTAWIIFFQMLPVLRELYRGIPPERAFVFTL